MCVRLAGPTRRLRLGPVDEDNDAAGHGFQQQLRGKLGRRLLGKGGGVFEIAVFSGAVGRGIRTGTGE